MKKITLLLIIALATIIRLATLPNLLLFTPDEAYISYIAQTIVKDFHIIWIGVSILGFDFYMGPFWIYFIYPFIGIFKDDPMILGVISSIMGIVTVYLLYWFGRKLYGFKAAIIASLMYATSALIIYYDQRPYPPGVPLLTLLMAISLYMSRFSKWWWVMFAFFSGLVFHVHLSLILVILAGAYWGFSHRKSLSRKIVLISVLVFTLTISPLIAFDYFHKASNITAPIRILKSMGEGGPKLDLANRTSVALGSLSRVWYLDSYKNNSDEILYPCNVSQNATTTSPKWVLSGLTLLLFIYFALKKDTNNNDRKKLLLLLSSAFLVPFLILPIFNPVEYYLLGFFPLLFLVIASVVTSLGKPFRYIAYLTLAVFVLHGIFTVVSAKVDYGIGTKKILIKSVQDIVGNEPFDLKASGGCHGGWRYLFSVYFRRPEQSSEDKSFAWLYPDEVSTKKTKYTVIIKETRLPEVYKGQKYLLQQGGFSAYVFEN